MSDAIFPALPPGLAYNRSRADEYQTSVYQGLSGAERRISYRTTPKRRLELPIEFLRQSRWRNELDTLRGFYAARRGAFDSFLLRDPADYVAQNQQIGVGDGTTTIYQLGRWVGQQFEAVHNPEAASLNIGRVWFPTAGDDAWFWPQLNGDWSDDDQIYYPPTGSVTLLSNGRVQFSSAPPVGKRLIWTGRFYWRARFADDKFGFDEFLAGYHQSKLSIVASLLNIL